MAVNPSSHVLTASAATREAWLKRLDTYIQNTSPNFEHQATTDNTGGGGDYGVLFAPGDSGESWQVALWWSGGTGTDEINSKIDPDAQMTDPLSRSNASGKASPDMTGWISSGNIDSPSSKIMIADSTDFLVLMIRGGGNGRNVEWHGHVGKILVPIFQNDPDFGLDGLAMNGDINGWRRDGPAVARIGANDWTTSSDHDGGNNGPNRFPNGRKRPRPLFIRDSNQIIGVTRTMFFWNDEAQLFVLEGQSLDGAYIVARDPSGFNTPLVPWDPTVVPL